MLIVDKGLDQFFHSLMPRRLRETLKPNGAEYIRARALAAILAIISVLGVGVCLVVGVLHLALGQKLFTYELVLLVITALILIQDWLYYYHSNYWASGLAFTIFYFLVATVMLVLSGGYDSPGRVFLLTCPMIAFLVSGWQEGLQNATLTVLFGLGLAALKAIGFDLPNIFYEENLQVMFIVNWLVTLTVLLACFIIYESGLEYNHRASDEFRDDARTKLIKFESPVDNFMHRLVPENLRQHLDIHSRLYARVKIMAVMLCAATLLSGVSGLILISVHLLFQPDHLKYDLGIIIITSLFGLQTWLFYRFQNHELSGLLLGYFCFFIILALIVVSGGYKTPTLLLLMLCPIAFFIVGGVREGIQNSLFVGLAGVVFAWLEMNGYEFANIFHDVSPPMVFSIMWTIAVTGIGLCLMAYDLELQRRE